MGRNISRKCFLVGDMWAWALLPISLTVWSTTGIWIVFIGGGPFGWPVVSLAVLPAPRRTLYWALTFIYMIILDFRYAIAVSNGSVNVTENFPSISKCGTYPPQSCIFGQILNVGAILVIWIIVFRFQQIRDYGCYSPVNSLGLAVGFFSALGTSIVGNFQVSNQWEMHVIGAFMAFIFGTIYFWIQTALTCMVKPRHGGYWMVVLRCILTVFATALIAMMITFSLMEMKSAAAICEWITAMILFVLFGFFCVDFWFLDGLFLNVMKRNVVIPNEVQVSTVTHSL